MNSKLQRRLQKLIATVAAASRSDDEATQNEADAAKRIAQDLLDAHGLVWEDVNAQEDAKPVKLILEQCEQETPWKIMLANAVAEFLGCVGIVSNQAKNIGIIGRERDIDAVRYMYSAFSKQLQEDAYSAWENEWFPVQSERSWKRTFLVHAANRLGERMKSARQQARNMTEGTALAKMDAQIAAVLQGVPQKRTRYKVTVGDSADREGRRAADRLRIESNTPLPATQNEIVAWEDDMAAAWSKP